jgi:hypothetical protein
MCLAAVAVGIFQVSRAVNPYEIFRRPLCLPDAEKPRLGAFALTCVAMQPVMAEGARMLAVIFIVSCLAVLGFYVYVLVQLRREEKREDAYKKRLPEHFYEMGPERRQDNAANRQDPDFLRTRISTRHNSGAEARLRRETMVGVGLTVGGLAAILAGIEFLNSLEAIS